MNLKKRWMMALAGSALAVTVALGASATFAQEPGTATPTPFTQSERGERGGHLGRGGPRGGLATHEALAEALGISVEELEAAQAEAHAAALAQAVEEGRLTQEEADQIESGERGPRGPRHGPRGGGKGEHEAFLADALGISVEELEAAKQEAHEQALTDAVAEGTITQEEADLIRAGHALRETIDHEAIMAEALGMTVEELEAAKAEGQRLPEIIEAQGLDAETVHAAVQAAHEEAVQQAVADGVITQEQADQLQDGPGGPGGRHGRGGHGPRGPRGSR